MPKGIKVFKRDFFSLPKKVQNKIIYNSMQKVCVAKYAGIIASVDDSSKIEILKRGEFEALLHFASRGKLDEIRPLIKFLGPELHSFVKAGSYEILRIAAKYGRSDIFDEFFEYLTRDEAVRALSCMDHQALTFLAFSGEFAAFQKYSLLLPQRSLISYFCNDHFIAILGTAKTCAEEKKQFYKVKSLLSARSAEEMGDFDSSPYTQIIEYMLSYLSPKTSLKLASCEKFFLIRTLSEIGDVDLLSSVLNYFSDDKVIKILKFNNYSTLLTLSENTDIDDFISILVKLDDKSINEFLVSNHNQLEEIFQIEDFSSLIKLANLDAIKQIIEANNNSFLVKLASDETLHDTLQEYLAIYPIEELEVILQAQDFLIPRKIATCGETEYLLEISDIVPEDSKPKMLLAKNFAILRKLSMKEEWNSISKLLPFLTASESADAINAISQSMKITRTFAEIEDLLSVKSDLLSDSSVDSSESAASAAAAAGDIVEMY